MKIDPRKLERAFSIIITAFKIVEQTTEIGGGSLPKKHYQAKEMIVDILSEIRGNCNEEKIKAQIQSFNLFME